MAYENSKVSVSIQAGADLSTKQYLFCVIGTGGQLAVAASAGLVCAGVLQDKPNAAGVAGELAINGIVKVMVGAAGVTAGDNIATDSAGKATTALTTNAVMGIALATGVTGDIIPMLMRTSYKA